MMSLRVTLPMEEEGADVDGAEGVEGVALSDCLERNCASLRLTIAGSIAPITWKWSDEGKGTEKGHKILMIVVGKMSSLRVVVSL